MKKSVCLILIAMLCAVPLVGHCAEGDGFAGYEWGLSPEEISNLRSVPDGGRFSVFEGEIDVKYLIGNIEPERIRLLFAGQKGLSAGLVYVKTDKNAKEALQFMKNGFGNPQVGSTNRTYQWSIGDNSAICLYFTSARQRENNFSAAQIAVYNTAVHRNPPLSIVQ